MTLRAHKLLHLVYGSQPILAEFVHDAEGRSQANQSYDEWLLLDQQLLGRMLATISEPILHLVLHTTHAYDAWNLLEGKFSSLS